MMSDMINFVIDIISDTVALMSRWQVASGISLLAVICAIMIVVIITRGLLR